MTVYHGSDGYNRAALCGEKDVSFSTNQWDGIDCAPCLVALRKKIDRRVKMLQREAKRQLGMASGRNK